MLKKYATLNQTCTAFGCSRSSIYKAIREGKLVARKFGARTLIDLEVAEKFFASLPQLHGGVDE